MIRLLLQSEPTDSRVQWILIALGVLTILYTLFRPSWRRKDPLKSPVSSLAQQRGVEREMQNLLVELSEMSRQISAQLDTRAARLELLIREADEKIARLKSLQSSNPDISPAIDTITTADAAPRQEAAQIDPRHARIYELADGGHGIADIARLLERPSGEIELILALRPRGTPA